MANELMGIVFYPESLSLKNSSYDLLIGDMCFLTAQGSYPDERWNDFIFLNLRNWANEIKSFRNGKIKNAKFDFMDGNAVISVHKISEREASLEFYCRYYKDKLDECVCSTEWLEYCVYDFSRELLKALKSDKDKWGGELIFGIDSIVKCFYN